MKSRIIKDYLNWINEDLNQAAAAPAQQTADGIAFIGASASASNLGDATKFGFKKDIVYTITMTNLGMLRFLDTDGSKFGGPSTQNSTLPNGQPAGARITINLDSTEKVAKPGDDMLEINGKKIYETGTLLLKKPELGSQITIKASNNGMLLLIRFGNALADMATRFKFYIGGCKNFAAKFTLGKAVAEADARGFTYYWAKPGSLGPTSNGLISSISIATLELLGLKDHIATTDGVFKGYYAWVAGKDSAAASTEITNKIAGFVKGNRMLTNSQLPDTSSALSKITKADLNTLVQYDDRNKKFKLKPEGITRITAAANTIAAAIAPVQPPVEFGDVDDVFSGYGDIIKAGLVTKAKADTINTWFDSVQSTHNWFSGTPAPGGAGKGGATQGEGQVGR
jgi:hypothetical protein